MEDKIIKIAHELFNSTITKETKMGDVELWDSLGQINLFMAIENEFELSFEVEEVIDSDSIEKIVELLNKSK